MKLKKRIPLFLLYRFCERILIRLYSNGMSLPIDPSIKFYNDANDATYEPPSSDISRMTIIGEIGLKIITVGDREKERRSDK